MISKILSLGLNFRLILEFLDIEYGHQRHMKDTHHKTSYDLHMVFIDTISTLHYGPKIIIFHKQINKIVTSKMHDNPYWAQLVGVIQIFCMFTQHDLGMHKNLIYQTILNLLFHYAWMYDDIQMLCIPSFVYISVIFFKNLKVT